MIYYLSKPIKGSKIALCSLYIQKIRLYVNQNAIAIEKAIATYIKSYCKNLSQ